MGACASEERGSGVFVVLDDIVGLGVWLGGSVCVYAALKGGGGVCSGGMLAGTRRVHELGWR